MKFLVVLPLVLALAAPLASHAEDHSKHGKAQHKLELNAGKKWATDDALRQAMSTVRTSVAATMTAVHGGKATDGDFDATAKVVADQVAYMVKNCKLEEKADAQLHTLIGAMMVGAEALEGKRPDASRTSGLVSVAEALNAYGTHFAHPGWQQLSLKH